MLKQPSSRSHRSKGFKVKHAVQVFVLAAVCVWLLYQVKHSHDKKIALEERSNKLAASGVGEDDGSVSAGDNILKLGRKDLPHIHLGTDAGGGGGDNSHEEDDGAEEVEEAEHEEDNKQEEGEEEEDGRGGGDDDIDENDQERGDEEAERGEELAEEDEEKERREHEDSGLLASNDHDLDREHAEANSQEAREVHYKEDDASSAVVKENENTVESEIEHSGGESLEVEKIMNGEEKHAENGERIENGESRQEEDGQQTENDGQIAEAEKKETGEAAQGVESESKDDGSRAVAGQGAENSDAVHEDGRVEQLGDASTNGTGTVLLEQSAHVGDAGSANSTLVGSNDQIEQQVESTVEVFSNSTTASDDNSENSTVAIDAKDGVLQLQNETVTLGSSIDLNSTTDPQTAVHPGGDSMAEKADDSSKQDQVVTEESVKADATTTAEGQQQEESSTTITTGENIENVLPAESTDSTAKPDAVTDEEKDARTDLSTLPEMQTDTRSVEDIAAE